MEGQIKNFFCICSYHGLYYRLWQLCMALNFQWTLLFADTIYIRIFGVALLVLKELECRVETGNINDLHAVSFNRSGTGVVGHIPRQISTPCNLFLRKGGTISCIVIGHRQYSSDLPQGGLEVPCQLLFRGDIKTINKIRLLLQNAPTNEAMFATRVSTSSAKIATSDKVNSRHNNLSTDISALSTANTEGNKSKAEVNIYPEDLAVSIAVSDSTIDEETNDIILVQVGNCTLLISNKECLLTPGFSLTDKHINFAQTLLRSQYPGVSGLTSTLLQYKSLPTKLAMGLQIIYCQTCHWVTAYEEDPGSVVKVYDTYFI